MPLSEHEQRILRQIERQFQQERGLAPLRMPAGPREASRNAKRAALGLFIGLVALLVSFASSPWLALVGFLVMVASGVVLVQSLRRLAQEHWRRPAGPGGAATGPDSGPGRTPWPWGGSDKRWPWWGGAKGGGRPGDGPG